MNIWAELLLVFLFGGMLGGALMWWRLQKTGSSHADPSAATIELQNAHSQVDSLEKQLQLVKENAAVRINDYQQRLHESQVEIQRLRQGYESRLEQMTTVREQELKQRATEAQLNEAEQGQVLAALSPVTQSLQDLKKRLSTLEEQRHQQFGTLSQQLKTTHQTEQQLHKVTQALESALRNSSTRGQWGETQLRNIVEASGLKEQVDFLTQVSIDRDGDRLRPDMIIKLPGGKSLPVDAKVPFDSYIQANEIPATGTIEQQDVRDKLLKGHVKAVRGHIDALSTKDYGRWVEGSPDFTIAFIPSEALLSAALETDPTLLDYAFRKRVALASPVTLWSVLKTISFAWQQETLTQEARQVFQIARELYVRLSTLGKHTNKLGKDLSKAVESYNSFVGSLERRVLSSARKLQAIDEATLIENLATIDTSPRPLTDSDLLSTIEAQNGGLADAEIANGIRG